MNKFESISNKKIKIKNKGMDFSKIVKIKTSRKNMTKELDVIAAGCCDKVSSYETSNCCDAKTSCDMDSSFNTESSCETGSCCGDVSSEQSSQCCSKPDLNIQWITGYVETSIGSIPQVSTKLDFSDRWGAVKVRIGIDRMNYKVNPGIYAIGSPKANSPVLVTANYKLTFDIVRKELTGENLWLLILDTKGVNVWCAAGKGTFGTKEIINQITKNKLGQFLVKKTLILPQLGATGACAHEITKKTGFKVLYGPVRITDIKEYIKNGYNASTEMRRVRFTIKDRLVLTPIEVKSALEKSIIVFGIMFLVNILLKNPFSWVDVYAYLGAIFAGCVITPMLLPFIPGRAFAWKGIIIGLIWAVGVNIINGWPGELDYGMIRAIGYLLVLPAVSGYYAMNFTGSSTYTSLSGVEKEMKISVPILLAMTISGVCLLMLNGFGF